MDDGLLPHHSYLGTLKKPYNSALTTNTEDNMLARTDHRLLNERKNISQHA